MAKESDASVQPSVREPVIRLRDAELRFGDRVLWHDLDLDVSPGEFVAVLGPNGTGKTSLLKVLLGQNTLSTGSAEVSGRRVHSGNSAIGYIPQQRGIDPHTPMRGRDLVRMGIDGHRWGTGLFSRGRKKKVDELLASVGAQDYADAPAGTLSGGELQRLRVAQALANDPSVLLCDEPLLSLDMHHQKVVAALLHEQRVRRDTSVVFVTHEINPILPYVDRILYIVGGHFLIGTPSEVMTTESLSRLYGSPVEVVRVGGRLVVVGGEEECVNHHVHSDELDPERGAI
ncbi:MAG: metal ABC transporter ATP-binding protein [Brevibacterium sp.]